MSDKYTRKQKEHAIKLAQVMTNKLFPFRFESLVPASQLLKKSGLSLESFADFITPNIMDNPIGFIAAADWNVLVWGYIASSAGVAECVDVLADFDNALAPAKGQLRRSLDAVSILKRNQAWKFIDSLYNEQKGSLLVFPGKK